jgi:hypothetical protein
MRDVETLLHWTRVVLTVCAVSVTLFPVLYATFSPWYRSKLGIAVMLQSIAVALIVDYAAVRRYISPGASSTTSLGVYIVLMSLVSLTSLFLTAVLLYLVFHSKDRENENV